MARFSGARLLLSLALLLPTALAQPPGWPADGGSTARTNIANVPLNGGFPAPHATFTAGEPVDDTASQIEGQLLNSVLVTPAGFVLIASDDCEVRMFEDPGTFPAAAGGRAAARRAAFTLWAPVARVNISAQDPQYLSNECEYAGIVIDNSGDDALAYFLDGRNHVVHALRVTDGVAPFALEWLWAVQLTLAKSRFELDVAMLVVPNGVQAGAVTKQLWVPLQASQLGADGLAITIGLEVGDPSYQIATLIKGDTSLSSACKYPGDYGSAVVTGVNGPAVAMLSSPDCGLLLVDVLSGLVTYQSTTDTASGFPTRPLFFFGEDGVHGQPAFGFYQEQLYFLDFADFNVSQRLCCRDTSSATFAPCAGWARADGCVDLPSTGAYTLTIDGNVLPVSGNYEWVALALDAQLNTLYVSASGVYNDDIASARFGVTSSLFAFSTDDGSPIGDPYRMDGDIFNSAPMIVSDSNSQVPTTLLVSSARGFLSAFPSGYQVSNGPLWSEPDFPAIPDEDLPSTTYSFLSATPAGTVLACTSAGGADWQDEKAFVAIANGVLSPSTAVTASSTPSPSPSATPTGDVLVLTASATPTGDVLVLSATATPTGDVLVLSATATPTPTGDVLVLSQSNTPTRLPPGGSRTPTRTPLATRSRSPTPAPAAAAAAAAPGLGPGASAGVAIGVLAALGAGAYFAATRVPAVGAAVDAFRSRFDGPRYEGLATTSNLKNARAGYAGSGASERTSIYRAA